MEDSRSEFEPQDIALLEQARLETEAAEAAAAAEEAAAAPPPAEPALADALAAPAAPAQAPAAAAPVPGAPAAPPPAPPATEVADAHGSTKAALRASRHNERILRDENAELRRRMEAAGLTAPAKDATPDEPDEGQINDVREYAPKVLAKLDGVLAENARLKALLPASAAAPAPPPSVSQREYSPETQAEIDESPELLLWQSSPEHHHLFAAAERLHEARGLANPAWLNKPASERFAAVVRDVKAEIAAPSTASTTKTLEDAQRVIAAAPAAHAGARTAGDLRGGAPAATNSYRDPNEMVRQGKTDEEIMAACLPDN